MIRFANDPLTLDWPMREASAPTRRSCDAASRFGLLLDEHLRPACARPALTVACAPNTVTLFTGPSGAGKSTLLHQAGHALRARGVRVTDLDTVRLRERPAVDLLRGPVERALRGLARVGLGQAACFLRRPRELSDGQRWRLRLAVALDAIDHAGGDAALLIDECCATLDPSTTLAVCATLRRAVARTPGLCVLCAGASPGLIDALDPHTLVRVGQGGAVVETRTPRRFGGVD
ncbi:MAG: adenylyl-sulfate kinase, partial [Phycisphaerales bacterium]